jgi:hypothetical protein
MHSSSAFAFSLDDVRDVMQSSSGVESSIFGYGLGSTYILFKPRGLLYSWYSRVNSWIFHGISLVA